MTDKLCYTLYEPAIKLGVPRSKQYALIGAGDAPPTVQIGRTRMVTAESCQRIRSYVDKIEAEFKASLDNERDLKGVIEDRIKRYALTTKQRR